MFGLQGIGPGRAIGSGSAGRGWSGHHTIPFGSEAIGYITPGAGGGKEDTGGSTVCNEGSRSGAVRPGTETNYTLT